jgi:hypothetical protein
MSVEVFTEYRPQAKTRTLIDQANVIIAEYRARGFTLTLRQLFYQFVARGWIENTERQYKRLGGIVCAGRDGGHIAWDAIEDRTRAVVTPNTWETPSDIIRDAAESYREDLWTNQPYRVEVWIEKDALVGVIEDVCGEYRVPYFAHRGNNSQTLQHEAGRRFAEYRDLGLKPLVLHLADHDPNGIDMTRDNRRRLALYAGGEIEVRRLALNLDQVRQFNPPPSFAKESDTRFDAYVREFDTEECWELDALDPTVIAALIRAALDPLIDRTKWRRAEARERRGRKLLASAADNWTEVEKLFAKRSG